MNKTPKAWAHRRRQNGVTVMFIITAVVILGLLYIHLSTEKTKLITPEYNTSNETAEWVRHDVDTSAAYMLTRNADVSLVVTCKDHKLTVQDLTAMTILRVVKQQQIRPIFVMGIDGKNWKIPIVSDDPNPTREDIEFLSALSKADWITFVVDNTRYTWPVANQTELSHCVDLNFYDDTSVSK